MTMGLLGAFAAALLYGVAAILQALIQPLLGDGHADTVGDALAEWAGGGFNAGSVAELRMAGSLGA